MKHQNQASPMIHPTVRIKKRKRKKDLDKLKDNIRRRKTANTIEELDNGRLRKSANICDRLLPEPCIGLYRNGAKSKQLKKSRSLTAVKKNKARIQGDIIKLLDGHHSSAKLSDNSNDDQVRDVAELKVNDKSVQQNAQPSLLKRMSPISTPTAKNSKPSKNLPEINERLQSVGRWRWSPLTCFEEFCAKISTETFGSLSIEGLPDPVRECRRVLAELYRETASCQPCVNKIHENIDNSPVVTTVETSRTRRRLVVVNKTRDKLTVNLKTQKFSNVNATDEYTTTDRRCSVPSSEVITNIYNQVMQKTANTREMLESRRAEQICTSIDGTRVDEVAEIPCHIDDSLIIDYCPTGLSAAAQWPGCEPQNLPYVAKHIQSPGVSASGPIFPFTLDLNIHKFWENDKKSKLDTTHTLLWTVNENNNPYYSNDLSKSYASYFPYKYENVLKRSEVLNGGAALKPLKNELTFEAVPLDKPLFHKRNKSFAYKSGQIHNHSYQTGEVNHHHDYRVYANDINEAVVGDLRVLSFNDEFKQTGKLAKDPRSRHSRQISQPTKYFAVKNERSLSFSPQRVPIYYHQSRDDEKSHVVDGKKPYYQPIRIIRPDETSEKN